MISFYKQENYVIKLPNDIAKGLKIKVYKSCLSNSGVQVVT